MVKEFVVYCKYCNNSITTKSKKRAYCNTHCRHKANYKIVKTLPLRNCCVCNKEFQPHKRRPSQMYCSKRCSWRPKYWKAKSRKPLKICPVCNTQFIANKTRWRTCSDYCFKKNADTIMESSKERWLEKHPKYHKIMNKKWYLKHRDYKRKQIALHHQKYKNLKQAKVRLRMKTDSLFKLKRHTSRELNGRLQKMNFSKGGKTFQLLSYTPIDLKNHLEAQFVDQMNWSNFGTIWNIDHIVPLSWFKTREQLIKRGWALKNLQPLEWQLNFFKGNRFVGNPRPRYAVICL